MVQLTFVFIRAHPNCVERVTRANVLHCGDQVAAVLFQKMMNALLSVKGRSVKGQRAHVCLSEETVRNIITIYN